MEEKMSKVVITLDTATKELDVKVDGNSLDDVTSVSIYKYEDYHDEENVNISINQRKEPEEKNGMCIHTTLTASESGDLVVDKNAPSPVQSSIANFIKSR
jgi:hypothetical protein